MEHRIVCAALRLPDGKLVLGVRHYDKLMVGQLLELTFSKIDVEQGFVCNQGHFWDRPNAWVIASNAEQIIRRVGGDDSWSADRTTKINYLFSENLY